MRNVTPIKNTGKQSEAQFENTINTLYGSQAYIYRITDAADLHGMNGHAVVTTKNPSDYIVTIKGLTMMAEVKSSVSATSFSFSCIKPNQFNAAKRMHISGGRYLLFVHELKEDVFHLLDTTLLFSTVDSGRSSLKWSEMPVWEEYERYKSLAD